MSEGVNTSFSAKERRKLRRQERKARQTIGHGALLNPETERGAEVASDCNLKGEPGAIGMKRDPASIQPPGQSYACISWVAPNARQKAKCVAIKIRGVFGTADEAHAHAAKIFQEDPDFDIHVVDMYEWLVIPPPMEHQMQIPMEYNQAKLDRIMKGYYHQIQIQKRKHDQRVASAIDEGKRKANAWRREHGYEAKDDLSKKLDPENPERVPVMPKPESSEGGWITDAAKGSLETGKAVQAEMESKGGRTVEDLEAAHREESESKVATETDVMRKALAMATKALPTKKEDPEE